VSTAVSPGTVSYNQAFEYDRWGNADCNPASLACANRSFNTAKNQIADSGFLYDAAGNMTADGSGGGAHTYAWDAEGRLKSADSGATVYVYNAFGQRVERVAQRWAWLALLCGSRGKASSGSGGLRSGL
jgi:YD repeat-containing protein